MKQSSSADQSVTALANRLETACAQINQNNAASLTNASKDRIRAKARRDEIAQLMSEFEQHVKVDPEVLD